MRFMILVKGFEGAGPPPQPLMDAVAKLGSEAAERGTMIDSGGLAPLASGTRVSLSGGKVTVTDRPMAEAKEVIGGYAVFEVPSREEMTEATVRFMELHRKYWPGWDGEAEIRQMLPAPSHSATAGG